ncbi:MAG: CHASE domain-containing protein, partial [Ignavibacteria bacterium]|nr:CHASE domain-containing protein [Ignavibacteria bacterium]
MKILLNFVKEYKALFISLLVFSLLIISTLKYTSYKRGLWEKDIRGQLMEQLVSSKSKLEKALYSRIYYTKGVAAYVSFNPEITDKEFQQLANELVKTDSVISTMALSKNCIIGSIYPLKGHEAAIGLDLLAHPERKEIVEQTINTHKTFIAGPVELIEGGIAFISYTPIFDKTSDNEVFWGITDIVIYKNQLFDEAGLIENKEGFLYALKGYNGKGETGEIFWGNSTVFDSNPVKIQIDLPDGVWILAAVPENGWGIYINQDRALTYALIFSSLIISILVGFVAMAIFKIQKNEKEQNAIFASMESLIVEIDKDGRYLKLPPTNSKLLYKPANELLGKT